MKIKCFRCGKEIESPNSYNSDYIIAEDTKSEEERDVFISLKDNDKTLEQMLKSKDKMMAEHPDNPEVEITIDRLRSEIPDALYDAEIFTEVEKAVNSKATVKIIPMKARVVIDKTAIVCPECYKKTDNMIWGIHKKE